MTPPNPPAGFSFNPPSGSLPGVDFRAGTSLEERGRGGHLPQNGSMGGRLPHMPGHHHSNEHNQQFSFAYPRPTGLGGRAANGNPSNANEHGNASTSSRNVDNPSSRSRSSLGLGLGKISENAEGYDDDYDGGGIFRKMGMPGFNTTGMGMGCSGWMNGRSGSTTAVAGERMGDDEEIDDADGDDKSSNTGHGKGKDGEKAKPGKDGGKKKRNRKPSSCGPCRKKKLRCDRLSPCGACSLRGESELCTWDDAVPLYAARDMNDTAELKAQVDRLQKLVDVLVDPAVGARLEGAMGVGDAAGNGHGNRGSGLSGSMIGRESTSPTSAGGHKRTTSSPSRTNNEEIDLRGTDVVDALSQLTLSNIYQPDEPRRTKLEDLQLLDEAKAACSALPQQFGLTSALPSLSSHSNSNSTSSNRPPLSEVGRGGPLSSHSEDGTSTSAPSPISPMSGTSGGVSQLSKLPYAGPGEGGLKEALQRMPSDKQANSVLRFYAIYVDWYLHPFHGPTFEKQLREMRNTLMTNPTRVDPYFYSLFMAICGVGLAIMPAKRAIREGFPAGREKDRLADSWLEAAMLALSAGRFLEHPNIEALRALLVINAYYVFMAPGEGAGSGITILGLGVQIAQQLGLNRDPDTSPGKYSRVEAEDRRRVFWTLFHLLVLSSSSLGRPWVVFDLNNIDTRLPLNADDHEIDTKSEQSDPSSPSYSPQTSHSYSAHKDLSPEGETVMTNLIYRIKVAQVAAKITSKAFGIKSVSYDVVKELDREIQDVEDSLPRFYQLRFKDPNFHELIQEDDRHVATPTERRSFMIHIAISQEYIRIHRPFLIKGFNTSTYSESRIRCLKHAKILLAISRVPTMRQAWGGINYKLITAATVLGIEILQNPNNPEGETIRRNLKLAVAQLEKISKLSSLGRKGAKLLKFLLEKDHLRGQAKEGPPRAKRPRVDATHVSSNALQEALSMKPPTSSPNNKGHDGNGSSESSSELPHKNPKKRTENSSMTGNNSSHNNPYYGPNLSATGMTTPFTSAHPQRSMENEYNERAASSINHNRNQFPSPAEMPQFPSYFPHNNSHSSGPSVSLSSSNAAALPSSASNYTPFFHGNSTSPELEAQSSSSPLSMGSGSGYGLGGGPGSNRGGGPGGERQPSTGGSSIQSSPLTRQFLPGVPTTTSGEIPTVATTTMNIQSTTTTASLPIPSPYSYFPFTQSSSQSNPNRPQSFAPSALGTELEYPPVWTTDQDFLSVSGLRNPEFHELIMNAQSQFMGNVNAHGYSPTEEQGRGRGDR